MCHPTQGLTHFVEQPLALSVGCPVIVSYRKARFHVRCDLVFVEHDDRGALREPAQTFPGFREVALCARSRRVRYSNAAVLSAFRYHLEIDALLP